MRRIFLYLLVFSLFSCSPVYNVEFKEYKTTRTQWLRKTLLEGYKAEEDDYSILIFTGGFENQRIKILNPQVEYEEILKSDESMGLARGFRINNTKPLKIIIDGVKIKLDKKNVSKYKFIYLGKNFGEKYQYTVSYSKTPRNFK